MGRRITSSSAFPRATGATNGAFNYDVRFEFAGREDGERDASAGPGEREKLFDIGEGLSTPPTSRCAGTGVKGNCDHSWRSRPCAGNTITTKNQDAGKPQRSAASTTTAVGRRVSIPYGIGDHDRAPQGSGIGM